MQTFTPSLDAVQSGKTHVAQVSAVNAPGGYRNERKRGTSQSHTWRPGLRGHRLSASCTRRSHVRGTCRRVLPSQRASPVVWHLWAHSLP